MSCRPSSGLRRRRGACIGVRRRRLARCSGWGMWGWRLGRGSGRRAEARRSRGRSGGIYPPPRSGKRRQRAAGALGDGQRVGTKHHAHHSTPAPPRRHSCAGRNRAPHPSFPRPPTRHSCAGRNRAPTRHSCAPSSVIPAQAGTHTHPTPTPPPSPIHPSPLPGGRLGGGWNAASAPEAAANTPITHSTASARSVRRPPS